MTTNYSQRTNYEHGSLELADLDPDPVKQLDQWVAFATAQEVPEPVAMVLSTVAPNGGPRSRVVLCRGVGHDGIRFFTNYDSAKGHELDAHPLASALFFWPTLERQVRIEGAVERLPAEDSAAYFASRPRQSQIGAWASPQSQVLPDRETLIARVDETTHRFAEQAVPLPPFWGGYRLIPSLFEFWQGRVSRLHDRFRYTRASADAETGATARYVIERLAP